MNSSDFKSKVVALSPKLYLVAVRLLQNREEARDAVQDVMVKLWKRRRQLEIHPNPSGYACLTTRNHCLDILRKTEPSKANETDIGEISATTDDNDTTEEREANEIIERIIAGLPDKQREIVLMRDIDGLEFDEIEVLTGVRQELIRVNLSRGRKRIREQLDKIYNYEYGKERKASKSV
jgi:RNA polymerase sigma-70 factor (ECF subfamily)